MKSWARIEAVSSSKSSGRARAAANRPERSGPGCRTTQAGVRPEAARQVGGRPEFDAILCRATVFIDELRDVLHVPVQESYD